MKREKGDKHMNKVLFTSMIILILMVTACSDEASKVENQPKKEEPTNTQEKDNNREKDAKPNPNDNGEERGMFSTYIEEISLYQMDANERQQQGIYTFLDEDIPTESMTLSLHQDSIYFFLRFNTQDEEIIQKLLKEVNVEGASGKKVEKTDSENPYHTRYKLTFMDTEQEVTLEFGDLPEIQLIKKEPLSINVKPKKKDVASLYVSNPYGGDHKLFFPNFYTEKGVNTYLIQFNEPMNQTINIADFVKYNDQNSEAEGEWIDEKTYQLSVSTESDRFYITLNTNRDNWKRILSQSGNYFSEEALHFRLLEEKKWKNVQTNQRVGWSKRDRFYDYILFSPDRSAYIGIVQVASGMGDAQGHYYSLVLEQKGKDHEVLDSFYTSVEPKGVPVQWLGNSEVLYADMETLYQINVESGKRKELLSEQTHKGDINYYATNKEAGEIYVLVEHFHDSFKNSTVDRWVLNLESGEWKQEQDYSELIQEGIYYTNKLSIHVTNNGVLWTKGEDGELFTIYEKLNGEKHKVRGEVVTETNSGVYLQTFKGKYHSVIDQLYFWDLQSKTPQQIADPPGIVKPFGPYMLSYKGIDTATYNQFNKDRNKWEETNYAIEQTPLNMFFQEVEPIIKK